VHDIHLLLSDLFFFSSRRRHTRWPRNWSSDVCSSDLATQIGGEDRPGLVDECPHLVEERGFVWHGVRTLLPQMSPDHGVDPGTRLGGAAAPRPGSPLRPAGAMPKPRAAQLGVRKVTYRPNILMMKT